jgi:hypothetical protein
MVSDLRQEWPARRLWLLVGTQGSLARMGLVRSAASEKQDAILEGTFEAVAAAGQVGYTFPLGPLF